MSSRRPTWTETTIKQRRSAKRTMEVSHVFMNIWVTRRSSKRSLLLDTNRETSASVLRRQKHSPRSTTVTMAIHHEHWDSFHRRYASRETKIARGMIPDYRPLIRGPSVLSLTLAKLNCRKRRAEAKRRKERSRYNNRRILEYDDTTGDLGANFPPTPPFDYRGYGFPSTIDC